METNFKMEIVKGAHFDRIIFHGNIDVLAETHLQNLPDKVFNSKVKFDFTQVGRINSMGVAQLLRCFKKIREDKKAEIKLMGVNTMHSMLFKMTGVYFLADCE